MMRGFYGAFIVHELDENVQIQERVMILSDWYHRRPEMLLNGTLADMPFEPNPDTILVNGRGIYTTITPPVLKPCGCPNATETW